LFKSVAQNYKSASPFPEKIFYRIGEVSRIVGVEPYVLRYWETEFSFIKPNKNRSGQRVYRKKDVELLLHVRRLLYQERYTIEGVRKKLGSLSTRSGEIGTNAEEIRDSSAVIVHIKKRLKEILLYLK
jgi:DNA-binding transcriptional MerR regulator